MESDDLSSLWGFNNPCSTDDRGFGSVMPMTDYIPKDGGQVISDEVRLCLLFSEHLVFYSPNINSSKI